MRPSKEVMGRRDRIGMLCERAHEYVSLRADGELSQLESAMLAEHLHRCAACARYAVGVDAVTGALRSAPPVPLRRQLALPRRQVAFRAARVSAAAAVMLVAAGLGSVFATSFGAGGAAQLAARAPLAAPAGDDRQLQDIRRAQLQIERAMLQSNAARSRFGHVT